jgi:hypothetical protein
VFESGLRSTLRELLEATFPSVSVTDSGAFMVSLRANPVGCKIRTLTDGGAAIEIESPVLLDLPPPTAELFQLICLRQREMSRPVEKSPPFAG